MGRKNIAIFWAFLAALIGISYLSEPHAQFQQWTKPPISDVSSGSAPASFSTVAAAAGTNSAPGYGFIGETNTGWYKSNASEVSITLGGTQRYVFGAGTLTITGGAPGLALTNTTLVAEASNVLAVKNSTSAQALRIYFSTTGPIYTALSSRTGGAALAQTGGAMQLSLTQTTVPTCSASCGTSPSVVGTDTAGIVTMGGSGTPASGWVITFNGTWPAAPACVVQSALTTMVVGKMPIAVQTTTTTATITTNGTAPAISDKYAYHCFGVS